MRWEVVLIREWLCLLPMPTSYGLSSSASVLNWWRRKSSRNCSSSEGSTPLPPFLFCVHGPLVQASFVESRNRGDRFDSGLREWSNGAFVIFSATRTGGCKGSSTQRASSPPLSRNACKRRMAETSGHVHALAVELARRWRGGSVAVEMQFVLTANPLQISATMLSLFSLLFP